MQDLPAPKICLNALLISKRLSMFDQLSCGSEEHDDWQHQMSIVLHSYRLSVCQHNNVYALNFMW